MSISENTDGDARGFWSSPGWLRLSSALMSGLAHDVTGRASALNSLSMVASRGLADSEMIHEELVTEAARLGAIAQLLDAFPIAAPSRGLGVSLADVAARLPEVLRLATDFRDAEVELRLSDTLPAVAIDAGPFSAVTLLLMADALDRSRTPACRIVGEHSGGSVVVTVEVVDARDGAESLVPGWLDDEAVAGASAVVGGWGGDFPAVGHGLSRSITVPTL